MKTYRNEWKYFSKELDLRPLREQITGIMEQDKFADDSGKYSIHSLYFDDIYDTCAYTNVSGDGIRFKYRIRFYNDSPQYLVLEKKEKYNAYCHKRSSRISYEEYLKFVSGDVDDFIWQDDKLKKEFAVDILSKNFVPKVIISYERYAYVEPISNVRITFDGNITASDDFDNFLNNDYIPVPVIDEEKQVLEVKFDYVLPSYIRGALQSKQLNQQAFSKYYMGRIAINNNYKF